MNIDIQNLDIHVSAGEPAQAPAPLDLQALTEQITRAVYLRLQQQAAAPEPASAAAVAVAAGGFTAAQRQWLRDQLGVWK